MKSPRVEEAERRWEAAKDACRAHRKAHSGEMNDLRFFELYADAIGARLELQKILMEERST
jgi:hypothetical protein